jgi:hypothetical protein
MNDPVELNHLEHGVLENPDRTFTTRITINAPLDTVIELLKLKNITRFNPLITHVELDKSNPELTTAIITDKIPIIPGLFSSEVEYRADQKIIEQPNGEPIFINRAEVPIPGSNSIKLANIIRIRTEQDGSIHLTEESNVYFDNYTGTGKLTSKLLEPILVNNLQSSHRKMFEQLKEIAEKESHMPEQ